MIVFKIVMIKAYNSQVTFQNVSDDEVQAWYQDRCVRHPLPGVGNTPINYPNGTPVVTQEYIPFDTISIIDCQTPTVV